MIHLKYTALIIAGVMVVLFILQGLINGFTEFMLLVPAMFHGYEIVTHMFIHADFVHLFYNLFALAIFGLVLTSVIGHKKFLSVFFVTGIIAGVSAFIFYADSAVLGASGAIMGIMGCLAVLRPKMRVWLYFAPMPMIAAVGLWAFIDLAGLISGSQGIANGAHLFGLASGIAYGFFLRRKYKESKPMQGKYTIVHIRDKDAEAWENKWF